MNCSIQARAFTTGQDVFFRSGEYNPGSRGGQELLTHELTHVVQQKEGELYKFFKDRSQKIIFYKVCKREYPCIYIQLTLNLS
ncbi:eCIS core domain-containing protein [Nostoc sp.]|uniref:eCIS core domain-containing protein n=1 Tax=Nostoc sp. TaxID=1180 RepID=UPI003FA5B1BE